MERAFRFMNIYRNRLRISGGFTLIEVLISLAILAIILTALYNTFFLTRKAMDRVEGSLVKYQEARMLLDSMRREADGLYFKTGVKGTYFVAEDKDIFGKPASKLSMTSFSFHGGVVAFSYWVEEKDGVMDLLKKEDNPIVPNDIKGMTVAEDIEGFSVEIRTGDKWVKSWDTGITNQSPPIVRFTLSFKDKGKLVSLSEIARPKVEGSL